MHQKTMLCSREGAPKVSLVFSSSPQARREDVNLFNILSVTAFEGPDPKVSVENKEREL